MRMQLLEITLPDAEFDTELILTILRS